MKTHVLLLCMAAMACPVASVKAEMILIDKFSDGAQFLYAGNVFGSTKYEISGPLAGVIGSYRDMGLDILSGPEVCLAQITTTSNMFSFTQGTATKAKATLIWDGNALHGLAVAPAGPIAIDLTADGAQAIVFDVRGSTRTQQLTMTLYSSTESDSATATLVLPQDTIGKQYMYFSDFVKSSPSNQFDFTHVNAIKLELLGEAGNISLGTIATAVPEPATCLMLAAGGLAILASRRLRKMAIRPVF